MGIKEVSMSTIDWAKDGGITGFSINCDECGEDEFYPEEYFRDFIEAAKDNGWRVFKDTEGDWFHLCRNCGHLQSRYEE